MKKNALVPLIAILLFGILAAIFYVVTPKIIKIPSKVTNATSFEECVAAGYPVQESYPERCTTADEKTFIRNIGNELEKSDLIALETPRPGQIISNPVAIKGKARGNWYFEASFPARLEDANGQIIGTMPIQAIGTWMTVDFVPFNAIMEFKTPSTKTGSLILQKDNPSGLVENDDELRVPVIFSDINSNVGEKTSIKVYFGNSNQGAECEVVLPAIREVSKVATIGSNAIEELLLGPTKLEQINGFNTALNAGVKMNSLSISNGIARVDFDSVLNSGVAGSCRVQAIRTQIEETLKQFSTVQNVIISINGEIEGILEP